jgi:hypothetical protein
MTENVKIETMHKEIIITPLFDFTEGLRKTAENISHDS